ncbi:MAG: ABC transporter substrate-binding protein [Candidatus Brachytrichaceae bacterium NZ_4S206]
MKRHLCSMIALAGVLLAACAAPPAAAPSAPADAQPTRAPAPAEATTAATAEAFPVTIEHKFGSTTIEKPPERMLSLGYNDQDPILALGVIPIARRYWFGDQPGAIFPWAKPRVTGQMPELLNMPYGQLNLEVIAALKPDLIIGVSSGITDKEYAALSQIAPTVAQSEDYVDFGVPWNEQTIIIGKALGKEQEARQAVAEIEARFTQARKAHSEFAGKTAVIAMPASDGQFFFSGEQHERMRFLTALGFVLPPELAKIAGDSFYGTISGEQLSLFDVDVLLWTASPEERKRIEENPVYQNLKVVKEGRVIWLDTSGAAESDLTGPALVFSSVLSLPIVFERLVPQLAKAIGGAEAEARSGLQVLETTSEYRLVKDALGEKKVPLEPKCIVVAGSGYLDHMLAVGVTPCGAAHGPGGSGFPAHLADKLKDVAYVGGTLEINLESVAALKPDLILAMHPAHTEGDFKTLLDPIATTVYLTEPWKDWRAAMLEISRVLGKEDIAEARLAEFEQKLADGQAKLSGLTGQKVMFLRVFPEKLRVYGTGSPTGDILYRGLGLTPATLTSPTEHAIEISLEKLPEIDADHIFLLDQTKDQMAALNANPLWQRLLAVQKNQVYPVDVKIWVQGEGVFAYEMLIEDVLRALSK